MDAAKEHQIAGALWARKSEIVSRVAWLSLDAQDSDLGQFVTYLVAALRTLFPDACAATLDLVHAQLEPPY